VPERAIKDFLSTVTWFLLWADTYQSFPMFQGWSFKWKWPIGKDRKIFGGNRRSLTVNGAVGTRNTFVSIWQTNETCHCVRMKLVTPTESRKVFLILLNLFAYEVMREILQLSIPTLIKCAICGRCLKTLSYKDFSLICSNVNKINKWV